jgi:hypothetical protein
VVEVVDASIPFLLGLDFMDRIGATPNTFINRLERKHGWSMTLVRHDDHIYLEWDELHQTIFSTMELKKLHRQCFHPSADKLYNLIKRARPEMAGDESRKILYEITATCHPCQMIALKPLAFTVGSANDSDITFNRELAIPLQWILYIFQAGQHRISLISTPIFRPLHS